MRDSNPFHGNEKKIALTNGSETGMGMAQIGMGMLIIDVFQLSYNVPTIIFT